MSVQLIEGFESLKKESCVRDPSGNSAIHMDNTAGAWSKGSYNAGVSYEHLTFKDSTGTHFFIAVRVWPHQLNVTYFGVQGPSGGAHIRVSGSAAGVPQIRNSSDTIVATGSTPLVADAWNLIELEFTVGDSTTAYVWIQGLPDPEVTVTSDFKNGTDTTGYELFLPGPTTDNMFDDIIVYDSQGSKNNSRVGDKGVAGIYPNGRGDAEAWVPPATSASRFYFPQYMLIDDAAQVIPNYYLGYGSPVSPAPAAEWDVTNYDNGVPFLRGMLSPYKQGTQIRHPAHNRPSPDATNGQDVLMGQFISPAIAAQTITGTMHMQMQVNEENTSQDQRSQVIVRVVSADGQTVRGTLYAGDTGSMTDEWPASRQNVTFPQDAISPVTMSSVTAQDGDRIVVEYGWRTHATGQGNGDSRENLGDGGASGDLPDSESDTTSAQTYNPWIAFSNAITLLDDTNFQFVDDAPADEDYTYLTAAAAATDLYGCTNVPSGVTVAGPLRIVVRAKKLDTGNRYVRTAYKTTGSTQDNGADIGLTTSYAAFKTYFDDDAGTDWTDSLVNGLQIGPKAT